MGDLVDLSLFSDFPASDGRLVVRDDHSLPPPAGSVYISIQPGGTMKPLPPTPRARRAILRADTRSQLCYPSRVLLDKMKRLRIEPPPASLDTLGQPSQMTPTLQQRRRRRVPNTPTLTIPTGPLNPYGTPAMAAIGPQQAPPMIWLANEQTWLVPDIAERDRDLYGYYAPAPHSDPGPWQGPPPPSYTLDLPPTYTVSRASTPDPSDLTPIQTQFLSLMESRRYQNYRLVSAESSLSEPPPLRDDKAVSPLFQEAISGVGFAPAFLTERETDQPSPLVGRRDTIQSDVFVSPLTPENDRLPPVWAMQRAATART